jgi:hypothetical protein
VLLDRIGEFKKKINKKEISGIKNGREEKRKLPTKCYHLKRRSEWLEVDSLDRQSLSCERDDLCEMRERERERYCE